MYQFQGLSYHDCWGNKVDEYICTKMQMPVIKCMQNDQNILFKFSCNLPVHTYYYNRHKNR